MNEIINLFSVPVLIANLSDQEKLTPEEIDIFKSIKVDKQWGDDGNFLSEEIHVLKKFNLSRIETLCNKYVEHYVKKIIGIDAEFKMFKSWLSVNEKGTKHHAHSHRNTMISCVMYFNENMSNEIMSPINFKQDGLDFIFKTFQFRFKPLFTSQYNSRFAEVSPRPGTVIVFPGWITHETDQSVFNGRRYCLGSNYFFNGESDSGYHNITVEVKI